MRSLTLARGRDERLARGPSVLVIAALSALAWAFVIGLIIGVIALW